MIKFLLTFAHKTGYLPANVGIALLMPKIKNTLAERILTEEDVLRMIPLQRNHSDKTLLRLLYLVDCPPEQSVTVCAALLF